MCKGKTTTSTPSTVAQSKLKDQEPWFLFSTDSYRYEKPKSNHALFRTFGVIILFFIAVEALLNYLFYSIQHMYPILQDKTNRAILARHIGVDSLGCWIVAYLGWKNRRMIAPMWEATFNKEKRATFAKGYESRMLAFQPESYRAALIFVGYQLKNSFDTIYWNDGIEFVIHHILCLGAAYGTLYPGSVHFYVPFYFGLSELSTAVLCLLANYDDVHGVPGLAEAFPLGKVVLGGTFAVLFMICRVFAWSIVSYFYVMDNTMALKNCTDAQLQGRKTWMKFSYIACAGLTILQVIWLFEIFRLGSKELQAMGLL